MDHSAYIHHRRSTEFDIDPEYRVGRLTFVCKIVSNHKGKVCCALMLCDCGKYCRVKIPDIRREELPWECPSCAEFHAKGTRALVAKAKKKRTQTINLERRKRKKLRWLNGLPTKYPAEHTAWENIRFSFKQDVPKHWEGEHGFREFLIDVGAKPYKTSILQRRDPDKPHSASNTYWKRKHKKTNPL